MADDFTIAVVQSLQEQLFLTQPATNLTIFDLPGDQLNCDSIRQNLAGNLYGNVKTCTELFMLHKRIYDDVTINPFYEILQLITADDKSDWLETVKNARAEKMSMHWAALIRNMFNEPNLKPVISKILSPSTVDLFWE